MNHCLMDLREEYACAQCSGSPNEMRCTHQRLDRPPGCGAAAPHESGASRQRGLADLLSASQVCTMQQQGRRTKQSPLDRMESKHLNAREVGDLKRKTHSELQPRSVCAVQRLQAAAATQVFDRM